jgi:hypothetical protein
MSRFFTAKQGSLTAKALPLVAAGIPLTANFCRERDLCREFKRILTAKFWHVAYVAHGGKMKEAKKKEI